MYNEVIYPNFIAFFPAVTNQDISDYVLLKKLFL